MKVFDYLASGAYVSLAVLHVFATWGFFDFFTTGNDRLLLMTLIGFVFQFAIILIKQRHDRLNKKVITGK